MPGFIRSIWNAIKEVCQAKENNTGAINNNSDVVKNDAEKDATGKSEETGKESEKENHHQLPTQFKDKFERVGLKTKDYVIKLNKNDHRLKPNGLHTGSENWNKQWGQFFENNQNPTKQEILEQLSKMRKAFGLE
jgi:hypothetical protein